jgi:hypothetical protein
VSYVGRAIFRLGKSSTVKYPGGKCPGREMSVYRHHWRLVNLYLSRMVSAVRQLRATASIYCWPTDVKRLINVKTREVLVGLAHPSYDDEDVLYCVFV